MPREVTYKVGLIGHEKHAKKVEGTTQEITVQIHELESEPWEVDAELKYVGTEVPRLDAAQKATGAAKYTYDMNPAGLAFAGLVTSPHAHARVGSIDASKAKAMKGVLAVRTMPDQVAKYPGKIVAAVCAESESVLDDALASIDVTYEVLPAAPVTDVARMADAPQVNAQPNVRSVNRRRPRDVSEEFAKAPVSVEAEYRTAVQTHSCLEPHGCTVKFEEDGSVTVWASTQATAGFAGRRFGWNVAQDPYRSGSTRRRSHAIPDVEVHRNDNRTHERGDDAAPAPAPDRSFPRSQDRQYAGGAD